MAVNCAQYLKPCALLLNLLLALSGANLYASDSSDFRSPGDDDLSLSAAAGSFSLQVRQSGKCLDISGSAKASGARAVQQTCKNTPSQQWKMVAVDRGHLQIVSVLSGLCLDVGGASRENGAVIQLATCKAQSRHQLWQTTGVDKDYLAIASVHSDKCLDVEGRSTADGAPIIQWQCHQQSNQMWLTIATKSDKPAAISCETAPDVSVEWTTEWREENYGRNTFYSNFFTPHMRYKDASYFVWIDASGRPQVSKIAKEGKAASVPLAANYKARMNSHNLFSLGIDKKGYIHISGDMQNGPNDRDKDYPDEYRGAKILYWVSKLPESVEGGFEFVGDPLKTIPARRVNGIRFFTDNHGELYSSAAVDAIEHGFYPGRRGVGLYKYNTASQLWQALGAQPPRTPHTKATDVINKVAFWEIGGVGATGEWQGFFSFFKFDSANRLHFATTVNTDKNNNYDNLLLYAVSEDGGYSWNRADGTIIQGLPLRANEGLASQADLVDEATFHWATTVVADENGHPGIYAVKIEGNKWNDIWYTWNGASWTTNNSVNELPDVPHTGNVAPGGSMILTPNQYSKKVYCQKSFEGDVNTHDIAILENYERFTNTDEYGLRTAGSLYGIAINKKAGKQSLVKITFKPAP